MRDQRGLTVVEVVVAAFLLVVVALAGLGLVDTSTRTSFRAEQTQAMINVAQREMEKLRDLGYGELAMSAEPAAGTEENDPYSRIRTTDGEEHFCLVRVDPADPCPAGASAPMVVDGEVGFGPLTPDVPVGEGDITVDVYRFVVWQDEGAGVPIPPGLDCAEKPLSFHCLEQDFKRAVVIVRVNEAPVSGERPYEELQSDFTDPDRSTLDAAPLSGATGNVIAEQFWLADTRCAPGLLDPPHATPTSSHETHNTLGNCLESDETNRPDALIADPPPDDPTPSDPNDPPYSDYATDLEPGSGTDAGLQMRGVDGCDFDATDPQKLHRWETRLLPPLASAIYTGEATLELWTRTIDDVVSPGAICIYLYKRAQLTQMLGDPPLELDVDPTSIPITFSGTPTTGLDCQVVDGAARCSAAEWPRGAWQPLRIELSFDSPSADLLFGGRLGVALSVDSTQPTNVLQFAYHHPPEWSRLEVSTAAPLP